MSSMTMTGVRGQTRAAWETQGRIFTCLLDVSSTAVAISPDKARHPAMAVNDHSEVLVSWSIGTGWQKGGQLGWTVLDPQGQPTDERGSAQGVPIWGMTAAYAEGRDFVVMY
jgi:hypothetical protein